MPASPPSSLRVNRPSGLATIPSAGSSSASSNEMGTPPSPKSSSQNYMTMAAIPIPGSSNSGMNVNAVAGPSSEGAIHRRDSSDREIASPSSSAPPTPSVLSVIHPSQFIHTHHPRRGSLTPLGLHLISPVPPPLYQHTAGNPPPSPVRSVGFSPTYVPQHLDPNLTPIPSGRRGSGHSSSSTLTSRLAAGAAAAHSSGNASPSHPFFPPNFNSGRRRSSLTPSLPTLAQASPTKAHAIAHLAGPNNIHDATFLHARARTSEGAKLTNNSAEAGRRGSLPHLQYGGWSGPQRTWNPILPPQRGSVGEEGGVVDSDFKFGGASTSAQAITASSSRALDIGDDFYSRRGSTFKRREDMNAFDQAEAEEAERQRRAFLEATYGGDGKRARERLSIGGPGASPGTPGTPGGMARRQSLMLWEKMGMTGASKIAPWNETEGPPSSFPSTSPPGLMPPIESDDFGPRRGSLPIAIPNGLGRIPSTRREVREARVHDMDAPPPATGDVDDPEDDDDDDDTDENYAPLRPLPPLLPLSDPGPRLLPSTLALHRASHMLNARHLEPEPLPHPLPPSLHPPAPVDIAEFDIDFILAGSQAQLGRDKKKKKNAPVDTIRGNDVSMPATPTLKLGPGGEDEDTFAKFVGEFDDEYGDRRGEWTFRACPTVNGMPGSPLHDPLDSHAARPVPKSEWESQGAGRYELFATGEVRSTQTGRVWKVRKMGIREYELEERDWTRAESGLPNDCFTLTGKDVHCEQGGVKVPFSQRPRSSPTNTASKLLPSIKTRGSVGDQPRNNRLGSEDSGATTVQASLATSLPLSSHLASRKPRQLSHPQPSDDDQTRTSVSFVDRPDYRRQERLSEKIKQKASRSASKDRSFSGFKKGLLNTIKSNFEERKEKKEEKERERAQSQSWSGASTASSAGWSWSVKSADSSAYKTSPGPERSSSASGPPGRNNSEDKSNWSVPPPVSESVGHVQSSRLFSDDEVQHTCKEGKGWHGVPDDAVAMIVPIDPDDSKVHNNQETTSANSSFDGPRQALLVWFVPFNSELDDRSSSSMTLAKQISVSDNSSTAPVGSSSLSKLPIPKLLRRRTSKDKEALKRENKMINGDQDHSSSSLKLSGSGSGTPSVHGAASLHPLPFRSFRVVARMVELDDLRSEPETPTNGYVGIGFDQWQAQQALNIRNHHTSSTTSSNTSPIHDQTRHLSLPTVNDCDGDAGSALSTAPTSTIMSGRTFPTVIAVCHSRSQGVEFVLEGLDRLGLCKGESAWGPTGYEEWRGTGLSEKGREMLDLLWAGCTGVMGLCS